MADLSNTGVPIPSLPLPFTYNLPESFGPGRVLFIHGIVNNHADVFQINLLAGSTNLDVVQGDVALHMETRYSQKRHSFNSSKGTEWSGEEHVPLAFEQGQVFDIQIHLLDDKIEVFANQQKIYECPHRIPPESIEYLNITGDVVLSGVYLDGKAYVLPFVSKPPNGHLSAGDRVIIYGIPNKAEFQVDFLGFNNESLFHFRANFDEQIVVRNAFIDGEWGREEKSGGFPFRKDAAFDLVIVNEPYFIQIFVDSRPYAQFNHRVRQPGADYAAVKISGDLQVFAFKIIHV
uniref:Galectin n=1 Tax=Panagrolaimus sp. JU765 TaxID=591449 RepID=A0AC34QM10_9BILA